MIREKAYPHISASDLPDVWDAGNGARVKNWKFASPKCGHSLHSMMSRVGSFPPALAHYFIIGFSKKGDLVLDPFCGKGTTLLEAVICGRRAVGIDVSPEAVLVSRAKLSGVDEVAAEQYIDGLRVTHQDVHGIPESVRTFYHDDTLGELLSLRASLCDDLGNSRDASKRRLALFVLGCLLGILHGHSASSLSLSSSHAYAMAPAYVRRYAERHRLVRPRRDVKQCLVRAVQTVLRDRPVDQELGVAALGTAEDYSSLEPPLAIENVDLIVTSPPYLNAQTYAKDAWLRLWLLGLDYRTLLHRYIQCSSPRTYKQRIESCTREMLKVTRHGAHAFVVAGDVPIRNKPGNQVVCIADLVAAAVVDVGRVEGKRFDVVEVIDDVIPFQSRYNSAGLKTLGDNGAAGGSVGIKADRIVHLLCT